VIYKVGERLFAVILFILLLPVLTILYIVVRLDSSGPFLFRQRRIGKNKKPFAIYKIRTMKKGADRLRKSLLKQNEADGPVFKIRNDPRFTRVGKFLSHSALDETPQLINIIRGEMALIGPRPLPPSEAKQVPKKYDARFSVLPGMTSLWVAKGAHQLTFTEWMEADMTYIKNHSLRWDVYILWKTLLTVGRQVLYTSR